MRKCDFLVCFLSIVNTSEVIRNIKLKVATPVLQYLAYGYDNLIRRIEKVGRKGKVTSLEGPEYYPQGFSYGSSVKHVKPEHQCKGALDLSGRV